MAQGTVGLDKRESIGLSKRKLEDDGDADADDGEDAPRRGMKTLTKVALVAVGWVLLTLFLVGQFSGDDAADESATARLDTVAGGDLDGDGIIDEVVEEEATDVNGDGIIEIGEGIDEGTATASVANGGDGDAAGSDGSGGSSAGSGGSSGSGSGSYQATPTESGSPNAVPGAPPPAGSTSGGTSSTTAGGGSGGGSSSTTSTTRATTSTTSGGGSGTTSTSTTTTTASGGGSPPPPPTNSAIILIVKARNARYEYPAGYGADFALATGSQVQFDNIESTGQRHSFTIPAVWDSGEIKAGDGTRTSPHLLPGTYTYMCTKHPTTMRGTIAVS